MIALLGIVVGLFHQSPSLEASAAHCIPFQADLEEIRVTIDGNGGRHEDPFRWQVYRDRRCRSRFEFRVETKDGKPRYLGILTDPVRARTVLLDVESGRVMSRLPGHAKSTLVMPSVGVKPANWPNWPGKGAPTTDDLGSKTIEGIPSFGFRLTFADGIIETWQSAEIGPEFALLRRAVTDVGEYEARLSKVRLLDPSPELFVPLSFSEK